eukprot:6174316-Pleurochrysis_carterae.AAC.2
MQTHKHARLPIRILGQRKLKRGLCKESFSIQTMRPRLQHARDYAIAGCFSNCDTEEFGIAGAL